MKGIFAILALVFLVGCTNDFKKDYRPVQVKGAEIKIDSSQWTPALIQVGDSEISVYESGEIRRVILWDVAVVFVISFVIGAFIGFISMVRD